MCCLFIHELNLVRIALNRAIAHYFILFFGSTIRTPQFPQFFHFGKKKLTRIHLSGAFCIVFARVCERRVCAFGHFVCVRSSFHFFFLSTFFHFIFDFAFDVFVDIVVVAVVVVFLCTVIFLYFVVVAAAAAAVVVLVVVVVVVVIIVVGAAAHRLQFASDFNWIRVLS